jgi:hypothetical protein
MDDPNTFPHILDLRDRMVRIETKLDGHNEAHATIDKTFAFHTQQIAVLDAQVTTNTADIASTKVRTATLAAVGAAALAIIPFIADLFPKLFG